MSCSSPLHTAPTCEALLVTPWLCVDCFRTFLARSCLFWPHLVFKLLSCALMTSSSASQLLCSALFLLPFCLKSDFVNFCPVWVFLLTILLPFGISPGFLPFSILPSCVVLFDFSIKHFTHFTPSLFCICSWFTCQRSLLAFCHTIRQFNYHRGAKKADGQEWLQMV